MSSHEKLLRKVEAFLRASGMSASAFGHRSINDGKLLKRLRGGQTVTLRTADQIEAFIAAETYRCRAGRAQRQRRAA